MQCMPSCSCSFSRNCCIMGSKATTRVEEFKMADAEGTETTQTEGATKPFEKEKIETMDEEQSTAQVQEEAPRSNENGHQTEEGASKDENKEESSKDNENSEQKDELSKDNENVEEKEELSKDNEKSEQKDEPSKDSEHVEEKEEPSKDDANVEQIEETMPEAEKEEKVANEAENGNQVTEEKKTVEDKPTEGTQEKTTEEPKEADKGHGATVAKHYNEHKENSREERKTSPIFYLRNFNNWVKSVLINEFMEKYKRKTFRNLSVLDLACGKGGDLLKWQKARISNLVCADIAEVSIKQCAQRYEELKYSRNHRRYNQSQKIYDAQFITADCSKELISEKFNNRNRNVEFDMTSCQFSLHYAFETPEQAEKMLQNACERLKPGGYFIGTIPCANELLKRLRQSETMSFENDCYKISFTEKENISLFGHKYDFHLEGVVDCPEFVVYFPLLEKMAAKFDMTLELAQGFHQFFEDHKDKDDYKFLLNRMNALETYPPRREGDRPMSDKEDAYTHAKEVLEGDQKDERMHVGTLRKDEWDAAGLYMVFAFKKAESKPAPMEEDKTEVTEHQSVQNDSEKRSGEQMEGDKNVEEMDTDTKMDEGTEQMEAGKSHAVDKKDEETDKMDEDIDEKDEGSDKKDESGDNRDEDADKKDEDAEKKDEDADKKDEDADKKDEGAEKKDEDADKKDEDADKKDEDADNKDEDADEKGEDADKKDEDADKKDEGAEKKDEDADKKDEDSDKKDEDADKKDEDVEKSNEVGDQAKSEEQASTEDLQEGEVGEKENTEATKKPTPQRGRRKRSVGPAKDDATTPEEESSEVTPKRGTRKRKSTGGTDEEPPEKKKA